MALAPHARKLNVGKRAGRHSTDQAVINRLLVRAARRHRVVVRLKGGDPMLFGRAQEEIDALRAESIPHEVVPGVSAAFAGAAEIAQSLTHRRIARSVVFVTPAVARGGEVDDRWADAAAAADTGDFATAAQGAKADPQGKAHRRQAQSGSKPSPKCRDGNRGCEDQEQ